MPELRALGRRRLLRLAAGGLVTGSALAAGGWGLINRQRSLFRIRRERTLMATSVSVTVVAEDREVAHRGIGAAFDRMASTAAFLTRFDSKSPVSRLNREGSLTNPPPQLRRVIAHALSVSAETDGDFDVTVEPVLDYYLSLSPPVSLDPRLRSAVADRECRVGYRSLVLDPDVVRFARPGMGITLDGIAKGHVVDEGIAALREAGIGDALIDAGGDVRAMARADGRRLWHVGIVDPQNVNRVAAVVRVANAAISTSGNYEVFFTADRSLYHIIDPHTGYSPNRYSGVTVVAAEAIESDALAVAAFSMPLARIKRLMGSRGAEWLAFSWNGTRRWRSRGLPLVWGQARVF